MKTETPKYVLARGGFAAVFGLAALLAACEAKLPTQSDVAQMDAAGAERSLAEAHLVIKPDSVKYVIDGIEATAIEAHRLRSDTIATVAVRGKTGGGLDTIYLRTLTADAYHKKMEADSVGRLQADAVVRGRGGRGDGLATIRSDGGGNANNDAVKVAGEANANVPVYIDGVLADMSALKRLNRDDIASIEVIKGAAAAQLNPDVPNADKGIIKVTTKHAPN